MKQLTEKKNLTGVFIKDSMNWNKRICPLIQHLKESKLRLNARSS